MPDIVGASSWWPADEFHPFHQVANLRVANALGGKLFQPSRAVHQRRRHREVNTEFGLQRVLGPIINQRQRGVGIERDFDAVDLLCRDGIRLAQIEHDIQRGMKHAGARIKFYADAGAGEEKWIAKT